MFIYLITNTTNGKQYIGPLLTDDILRLRDTGLSFRKISQKLGIGSHSAVRKRILEHKGEQSSTPLS